MARGLQIGYNRSIDSAIQMRYRFIAFPGLLIWISMVLLAVAAPAPHNLQYRLTKKVILGGEGGWDYFDVDPDTGHVFIPRGSHVLVVDSQLTKVADIPNVGGAHAIAFAPELKKAFLSTEAAVSVLDLQKMSIASEIPLPGKDPDAILYDKFSNRVFTFNGGGTQDASAIGASTGKVVGTLALGGKPEFAQTNLKGHIYVNIEDKSEIVDFDAKTLRSLHHWPLAPCEHPTGWLSTLLTSVCLPAVEIS